MNKQISSNETESVIKKKTIYKGSGPDDFIGESYPKS